MKKYLLGILGGCLLFTAPIFAHPPISVYVDGTPLTFDQPPVIIEDRTLVPMRAIFQALGCDVSWIEETKTIVAQNPDSSITLQIGSTALYKNGQQAYTMPVPAKIINERTMVPLRAISEALGADVEWDGQNYTVIISSKSVAPDAPPQAQEDGYHATVKADDGTTVLTVKIDTPKISGAHADAINEQLNVEAKKWGESFVREYGEQAKAVYAQEKAASQFFAPYYCVGSFDLTRNDSSYISYFGSFTQYMGDNQDERDATSFTYSAKTGKELGLKDIISDTEEELFAFWQSSFGALIQAKPQSFYPDAEARLEEYMAAVGFYLTTDGIGFYLPPATIAPKETGILSFTIKYAF